MVLASESSSSAAESSIFHLDRDPAWLESPKASGLGNLNTFIHPVGFSHLKLTLDMSHQGGEIYNVHWWWDESFLRKCIIHLIPDLLLFKVYQTKNTKQIITRQIQKFFAILWLLLLVEKNLSKGRSWLGPKKWTRQKIAPDSFYLPTILYWNYGCPPENRVKIKLR